MKLFIKLILFIGMGYLAWTFFVSKNNSQPLVSFTDQNGSISFNIREKEKAEFKLYLKKVKNFIYREATIHNPEGDVLPDNIDNKVINEVKEKVN